MLCRPPRLSRRPLGFLIALCAALYPILSVPEGAAGERVWPGAMLDIVMADDGIAFDGRTAASGPLGGAETAFVALAEAFAGARPPGRGAQPLPGAAAP